MDVQGAQQLVDLILKPENLIVVMSAWILISTATKAFPKLATNRQWKRLLPVLPIVLCEAAMWLPGVAQETMSIGDKVLLGCILGWAVGHTHKMVKRTGMGK
jgi:hypothetical protein